MIVRDGGECLNECEGPVASLLCLIHTCPVEDGKEFGLDHVLGGLERDHGAAHIGELVCLVDEREGCLWSCRHLGSSRTGRRTQRGRGRGRETVRQADGEERKEKQNKRQSKQQKQATASKQAGGDRRGVNLKRWLCIRSWSVQTLGMSSSRGVSLAPLHSPFSILFFLVGLLPTLPACRAGTLDAGSRRKHRGAGSKGSTRPQNECGQTQRVKHIKQHRSSASSPFHLLSLASSAVGPPIVFVIAGADGVCAPQ